MAAVSSVRHCSGLVGHTVLVLRMAHRKWKKFKQQPSMLPGSAVSGCCLVSFHFLWDKLSTRTVEPQMGV